MGPGSTIAKGKAEFDKRMTQYLHQDEDRTASSSTRITFSGIPGAATQNLYRACATQPRVLLPLAGQRDAAHGLPHHRCATQQPAHREVGRCADRLAASLRDRGGDAVVQFAIGHAGLLLLIVGSFEVALLLFISGTMKSAVFAASRYGITGFTEDGVSREQRIREIIDDRTMGFVDLKTTKISTLVYASFDNIGQPEPFTETNENGSHDCRRAVQRRQRQRRLGSGYGQGWPGRAR